MIIQGGQTEIPFYTPLSKDYSWKFPMAQVAKVRTPVEPTPIVKEEIKPTPIETKDTKPAANVLDVVNSPEFKPGSVQEPVPVTPATIEARNDPSGLGHATINVIKSTPYGVATAIPGAYIGAKFPKYFGGGWKGGLKGGVAGFLGGLAGGYIYNTGKDWKLW